MIGQTDDADRGIGERIVHRRGNDRPFTHANERRGNLRRLSLLSERGDRHRRSGGYLGSPVRHPDHQMQIERIVSTRASGDTIVVRLNKRQVAGNVPPTRHRSQRGGERESDEGTTSAGHCSLELSGGMLPLQGGAWVEDKPERLGV